MIANRFVVSTRIFDLRSSVLNPPAPSTVDAASALAWRVADVASKPISLSAAPDVPSCNDSDRLWHGRRTASDAASAFATVLPCACLGAVPDGAIADVGGAGRIGVRGEKGELYAAGDEAAASREACQGVRV